MEFRTGVVYVAVLVLTLAARESAEPCPDVIPQETELELACDLPSGTEIELNSRIGQYITLECGGNGTYSCKELPKAPNTLAPLSSAMLKNCELPHNESLLCTLEALGAGTATSLSLRSVPGGSAALLTPKHVHGLLNVTSLTLVGSGAAYAHLPAAALAALPLLRRLTVRDGSLRLTPDSLANVSGLDYLELSMSNINELPAGAFHGLESLRTLNLWGNDLRLLQPGALEGLRALETLDLSSNPLQSLGDAVLAEASSLRVLRLVNTELGKLDEPALQSLEQLEELIVLDERKPLVVGPRALALSKLRIVQIERCSLSLLPSDALAGARSLRSLSLSHNSLETLPNELLQDAGELRALNLSRNALKELTPELLKALRNLEELNVDNNQLEILSDNLFQSLHKLTTFSARNNRLRVLSPTSLQGAFKLSKLDLAHNQLTLRDTDALVPVTDGYLDVGIDQMSPMNRLYELTHLDLSNNLINQVFYDWRNTMLKLELLNLTHNEIDILLDADISFLSTDLVVDFRYNKIGTIQIFETMQFGAIYGGEETAVHRRILLDENPYNCDCHMYTLVQILKNPSYTRSETLKLDGAVCVSPPELTNVMLREAPLDKLTCAVNAPECPDKCNCTLRFARNAIALDCIETPVMTPVPSNFGVNRTVLRLRTAPKTLNLSLPVNELILTGLGLTIPPLGPAPPELELLDLSSNLLKEIPPVDPIHNYRLRLAHNPLVCDCAHSVALKELQRSPKRVDDWRNVTCFNGDLLRLKDATGLCASARAAWAAGVGSMLALLGVVAIILTVLWLRYQNDIKVYCFARGWCGCLTRAAKELPAKYDVFLSFSHKDDDLVVKTLVPELERRGYRVCIHYRDWAPGKSIAEHVSRSVHESRRTLVVVSSGFLCSEWAQAEFREAHARALREGRTRVIVVLLGELPPPDANSQDDDLRRYLRTNTYVKWGEKWFWDKLQYALPRHPLGEFKEVPLMSISTGTLSVDALRAALEIHLPKDKLGGGLEPRLLPPPPAL